MVKVEGAVRQRGETMNPQGRSDWRARLDERVGEADRKLSAALDSNGAVTPSERLARGARLMRLRRVLCVLDVACHALDALNSKMTERGEFA